MADRQRDAHGRFIHPEESSAASGHAHHGLSEKELHELRHNIGVKNAQAACRGEHGRFVACESCGTGPEKEMKAGGVGATGSSSGGGAAGSGEHRHLSAAELHELRHNLGVQNAAKEARDEHGRFKHAEGSSE